MQDLYELKEMLCEELKKYGKKGDLTAGSLDVVDKLAHAVKNIDKIIEAYEDEEYSGAYDSYAMERGGSYERGGNRGGSYRMGGSYARGRGRNARRDSMGRYSSTDGYSRHEDMLGELRYLMQNAPDEHTRMEFQKFITKMEQSM